MREHKALLDWGGKPLLAYQLEQMTAVERISEIVVVTGFAAERLRPIIASSPRAREALNSSFDDGKAGSVRTGVAAVRDDAASIVLLAVDQPRPAGIIAALLDAHVDAGALISVPVFRRRRGHPIVFDAELIPELLAIDDATLGVRAILARHDVHELPFDDPIVCLDLNTPEDVVRGRQLLRGAP